MTILHALPFLLSSLFFSSLVWANPQLDKNCLYIASYSPGYDWQDRIEKSLTKTVKSHCQLETFYMKSKKVLDPESLQEIGKQTADLINKKNPDVVIVSDDNAVKYVLEPYFKNHDLPFVFCGVHDTYKPYGLPYGNTTGIIEKSSIEPLLKRLMHIQPSLSNIAFLTTKGTSASRVLKEYEAVAQKLKLKYLSIKVNNEREWRKRYKQLQENQDIDVILFSNFTALPTWNHQRNLDWITKHNHKLSIATARVMMPYVALGLTKVAEEHGNWAGLSAIAILDGIAPNKIKVVPNQKFQFWINPLIAAPFKDQLPEQITSQSIKYQGS